ncbi:NAD-dependent dihydropyrimidine dehydrogenase subunit PreA [Desulfovibrio sp. UCD-KL4C]|uniref:NAD-dependent dihydropyrimidine dehydrogenase subunit PreA n=1 Tax=Desulfovibrio sp. UCD-KL4C TaxID=2578120 RepID=UPI0025BA9D3C|nr:NAD-dependent dihydropyrimidine dehydrogenase subunit PreA [Desulfovibrio sp. UCD-KL4C]
MSKIIDLSVTQNGITFPNPFLLASAPPTAYGENIMRAFDHGWGGAVLKTLKPDFMDIKDVTPRFATLKDKNKVLGFQNFELVTKRSLADWLPEIEEIKKKYPKQGLIGSIMADIKKESWQEMAKKVQGAGCDGLELNFSCPHGMPERGIGAAIGQDPELVEQITSWVKEVSEVPVWVKITPNIATPIPQAEAALRAGADGLAAINTVQCLMGVDVENFNPLPAVEGQTTYGGYSGRAVKPIGLRIVSQLGKMGVKSISGIGGVSDWKDAVEYMLLGSTTVQVCTEVMLRGYAIVDTMIDQLTDYLGRKEMSAMDLVGKALPSITSHESLSRIHQIVRHEPEQCVSCGRCVIACSDSGYSALRMLNREILLETEKCDGCSLCTHVCPTGSMSMQGACARL